MKVREYQVTMEREREREQRLEQAYWSTIEIWRIKESDRGRESQRERERERERERIES